MQQFTFTVKDPLGIHARPAGIIAKMAKPYSDTLITITKAGTTVKASQLMKLMSLAVKNGDEVVVAAEGPSEEAAIAELKKFFDENL
jgi:phosphocarrier protein